ncbi:unnamed protein product [Ceratitis capitata]|uniref:(Mediterranean fruit fly) hypothetical protein n=1 Tax=Ceratitis capitata TaxID=7213 RepID=A0A811V5W7_CERCA|nr:unnamed protein product [Ceratitis capitata]
MTSSFISSLALLFAAGCLISLLQLCNSAHPEYPGVIELVGYSNRRARTHYIPPAGDSPTLAPPPAKIQADIETVKANIEKYNKLLTLDTKNLPESQKDMLERIVERVARLKESLDIDESERLRASTRPVESVSTDSGSDIASPFGTDTTTEASTNAEAETDPTLVLDETTLLQLQTSMDELAAAQAAVTAQTSAVPRDIPTTTEYNYNAASDELEQTESATDSNEKEDTTENLLSAGGGMGNDYPTTTVDPLTDATDSDDQFVAARSNNNIAAASIKAEPEDGSGGLTTIGSQRTLTTSGKLTKTRATKRPGSGGITKTGHAPKRGQKPGTTASVHRHTVSNKQKLATTTTQPLQQTYHHQQQQQQHPLQLQQTHLPKQPQQLQYSKPQQTASSQLPLSASSPLYQAHKVSVSPPATQSTDKTSAAAAAAAAAAASAASTASIASLASAYSSTPVTTTLSNNNNYGTGSNVNNDMDYEPQVNTSALIDSLNHAREEFYQQKQSLNNKDKENEKF